MLRLPLRTATALGMVLLLFAPRLALGQNTGGYYYETFRYGYNPGCYARRYQMPPDTSGKPAKFIVSGGMYLYRVAPTQATSAGVPRPVWVVAIAEAESAKKAEATAQVELRVPEGAVVWFEGEKTAQTGSLRRFVTPPLAAGHTYTYEVRVAWKGSAGEVTETRRLSFAAGDRLSESFPAATARLDTGAPQASSLPPAIAK